MKISFSRKIKSVLSFILILIGIILMGNTNNNPTAFIERIFKPIIIGKGTLYYSVIFTMLLIYFGFKWMYEFGEYKILNTKNKRILATFLVVFLSSQLTTPGIKIIKSMSTGLNSIYYNRSNISDLSLNLGNKSDEIITCTIELENCSEKAQEFYIKVLIPQEYKEFIVQNELVAKESDLKVDKKFILRGKEKSTIKAVFLGEIKKTDTSFQGSISDFEFLLINDKEEVKFIKRFAKVN
jgi:hypothetical protein